MIIETKIVTTEEEIENLFQKQYETTIKLRDLMWSGNYYLPYDSYKIIRFGEREVIKAKEIYENNPKINELRDIYYLLSLLNTTIPDYDSILVYISP